VMAEPVPGAAADEAGQMSLTNVLAVAGVAQNLSCSVTHS